MTDTTAEAPAPDIPARLRALSREMVKADMDMSLPEGSIDPAEAADEITNLRAAQSNLIGTNRMLKQQVEDRDATITRLTADNERLRAALEEINMKTRCIKAVEIARAALIQEKTDV
jgi:hypothetical protein